MAFGRPVRPRGRSRPDSRATTSQRSITLVGIAWRVPFHKARQSSSSTLGKPCAEQMLSAQGFPEEWGAGVTAQSACNPRTRPRIDRRVYQLPGVLVLGEVGQHL